jgi:protocatechuate 3,4-dioxygenase beta subunit
VKPLLVMAGLLAAGTTPEGVRGVVVDGNGKPVAGAVVVLVGGETEAGPGRDQSTRSDDRGRFAFEGWRDDGTHWFVLAHKAGLALGGTPVRDSARRFDLSAADTPPHDLKLRLLPPAKTRVRVEGPDGKSPGEQASLALVRCGTTREQEADGGRSLVFDAPVPRALAEQLGVRLGRDGVVVLDCLPPHSVYALEIKDPALGTQQASYLGLEPPGDKTVRLQPVGSLSGRVVARDPKVIGGVRVRVQTAPTPRPSRAAEVVTAQGHATAVTDEAGRFEIKGLAAGQARLSLHRPGEQTWLPPAEVTATVEAGKTAEVKIELKRGVHVRGRVVAEETGQGVEGVLASVGAAHVTTDAKGEFQAYAAPGQLFVNFLRIPLPWLPPFNNYRVEQIAAGREVHELAPVKLKRGLPLEGTVVDEGGRPTAGARVSAVWRKTDGTYSTLGSEAAVTGDDGRFVLRRVPGDVELGLAARTDERATDNFTTVPPKQRQPVRLTVRAEAAVAFEGRVRDDEGKAVPDARVQFRKAIRLPSGQEYGQSVVPFGEAPLKTDAGGTYRTPSKVARHERYSMVVEAPGLVNYESGYVTPVKETGTFRWPDVVLRRDRVAAGVVVDRSGKPVSGAAVWSHGLRLGTQVTAESDAEGKFRLARLHPDARLVFIDKVGHRPTGGVIPKRGELRVTLEPEDAPPAAPLRSVRRSAEERVQLLKDLLVPLLPRLADSGSDYFVEDALKRLARHDRAFVLSRLDRIRTDRGRADVLAALGEVDDALESASLAKDPYGRSFQYLTIADAAADPARKRQILAEALVHGRLVERPDHRVVVLCGVADRLLGLGDRAGAQKVLDEAKPVAGQLAPTEWSGYARGCFAEALAPIDPAAAFEALKAYKDEDALTRHAGNIAHRLAGSRPAEAEQALKLARNDDRYVSPYAVRVCYRMAPADLPRAKRIADGLKSSDPSRTALKKAQAYGAMAVGLAGKDPVAARELLRLAFDQLAAQGRRGWQFGNSAFPVAATLLGYSEAVDPARTREYFWRALALHPGPVVDAWSPDETLRRTHENTAQLALLLALFGQHPDLQTELLEPIFRYWSGYTNRKEYDFYRENGVFTAMALADPRRAIAWHRDFHPKVSKEDRRLIPQPWMAIADVIGHEGAELHGRITEQVFHLWAIDKEDL